jgi:hypothetical protein
MAQADYVTNAIRSLITDASPKPSTNPLVAACAGLKADLARHCPPTIPLNPHTVDLDRADHLRKVLTPVSVMTAILLDTANLAGRINLRQIDTLLSDFAPDVAGTFQRAAVSMAAWRFS